MCPEIIEPPVKTEITEVGKINEDKSWTLNNNITVMIYKSMKTNCHTKKKYISLMKLKKKT